MKALVIVSGVLLLGMTMSGCKKDFRGVCKCKYVSGDVKEFNYSHLTIAQANAKCDSTSQNAAAFGGECKME